MYVDSLYFQDINMLMLKNFSLIFLLDVFVGCYSFSTFYLSCKYFETIVITLFTFETNSGK